MSTRHIARTLALQTLFEVDIQDNLGVSIDVVDGILIRNLEEFGEGIKDGSFAKEIVRNALTRRTTIDDIITRAAPDWPLAKISIVDRNILRIGLTELLFGDRAQVPPKVAIDEAIELAKSFGGETSGRFVNGVLGAIYKEMGEPDKDQTTKTKQDHLATGKKEILAGAVILSLDNGIVQVGLVHDVFGYWTLPKGHIGADEDPVFGVVREIKREVAADITPFEKLGENEYIANKPEIGKVVKHVSYFLAVCPFAPLVLEKIGGLDEVRWFPKGEVADLRIYEDIKPLIKKALEIALDRDLFS
jgi:N utilization substance protein B